MKCHSVKSVIHFFSILLLCQEKKPNFTKKVNFVQYDEQISQKV